MGLLDGVFHSARARSVLRRYVERHAGIEDVVAEFERSGYGQEVHSWIGEGGNLPLNAQDVKKVLGPEQLQQIAESTGVPIDETAAYLADNLPKYLAEQALKGIDEQSLRTADVVSRGIEVFGSREAAERWLGLPAIGLGDRRPIDLLKTPEGARDVSDFLDQLKFGVYV